MKPPYAISQSLVDPAEDPKQALPSAAARHAHWASILEQSGTEKDMSGDPEEYNGGLLPDIILLTQQ